LKIGCYIKIYPRNNLPFFHLSFASFFFIYSGVEKPININSKTNISRVAKDRAQQIKRKKKT
jgi:hypothetical protein